VSHKLIRAAMRTGLAVPEDFRAELAAAPKVGTDPETLAAINALPGVLTPYEADGVIVRGVWLANDQPFKDDRRQLAKEALRKFVPLAPNVPVMLNHSVFDREDAFPFGRTIDARVRRVGEVSWLFARWFTRNDDVRQAAVAEIDGGLAAEASLGFDFETSRCSICKSDMRDCSHWPGQEQDGVKCRVIYDDPKVWLEWSIVPSGAIQGTHYALLAGQRGEAEEAEALEARLSARGAPGPIASYFKSKPPDPWDWARGKKTG
jgi:hypothetical protein